MDWSENGTTERTGDSVAGLVEAIERGILAPRETRDRHLQRMRGVLRGAAERTKIEDHAWEFLELPLLTGKASENLRRYLNYARIEGARHD
jgi:hypothetical protein